MYYICICLRMYINQITHLRSRHTELPILVRSQWLPGLHVHHLGHGVGDRVPAAPEVAVLDWLHVGHGRGLSHSESLLEDRLVGGTLLHEVADEGWAKRSRATSHELDRGEVLGLDLLVCSEVAD